MIKEEFEDFTTYHSNFEISNNIAVNHTFTLMLNLHLQQVSAPRIEDGDGKNFALRNWRANEWQEFVAQVRNLSNVWNDKFWLIPPNFFKELDIKQGDITYRPNIKCHLFVQVFDDSEKIHKTIKAAKLADNVKGTSITFRSHAELYDSLDATPYIFELPKPGSREKIKTIHYAIPHEIGHALGQPHIGILRNRQKCLDAIAGVTRDKYSKGGDNSAYCYGHGEEPSISENIMGYGMKFDKVNAKPWTRRIEEHTKVPEHTWEISMTPVPPKIV